jgi:acylphosphatase
VTDAMTTIVKLRIEGRVQGVGYRFWLDREARRHGLTGWVRNRSDGSVEALLKGDDASVGLVIEMCRRGPRMAVVERIDSSAAEDDGSIDFRQLATG